MRSVFLRYTLRNTRFCCDVSTISSAIVVLDFVWFVLVLFRIRFISLFFFFVMFIDQNSLPELGLKIGVILN